MSPRLLDLQEGAIVACGIAVAAVALGLAVLSRRSKLDAIPTVGSSSRFGAWASIKYVANAPDIIQEGYDKYKHKSMPFKVAELYHWLVIFSDRKHVEELQRVPADLVHVEYTMGPEVHRNPYHVSIVRSQLTRNLAVLYPELRDEVVAAFDDVLDLRGNEWKRIPALHSIQKVVCRTSNRLFVGLPLCRDPKWIDLNVHYTTDVVGRGFIIALFPKLLKPVVAKFCMRVSQCNKHGRKLLEPIIDERQKYLDEYAHELTDRPNDFLSWLMEEAEGPELTIESLTRRILVVNFQAIHTSSHSFGHILFYLAANPQYIQPLRKEVEDIVTMDGWSKVALGKMKKVDSFLRECLRIETLNYVSLQRKALKDLTLSDGTFIPRGTMIAVASQSIHHDGAVYDNALAFEPFRFAHDEDSESAKCQFVSTSAEYLPFGHGRQACPGRFFAATELKTMLAHVVVSYDVKLEDDAARPQSLRFVTANVPDPRAKVMFRRRVD